MTGFEIQKSSFTASAVSGWAARSSRFANWPVVYVLDSGEATGRAVYVGETRNAIARMRQHLESEEKRELTDVRVVLDETFNKSVCLDLEAYLIGMFSGDGGSRVLNRNAGLINADYYDRARYRAAFDDIFEALRREGLFARTRVEIVNSDLFKLSPFKALTDEQAAAVEEIVEGLLEDIALGESGTIVIQGVPGTGKTVVGIYLVKLLADIRSGLPSDEPDLDSPFGEFFLEDNEQLLATARIAVVVPQQSLRRSIKAVFAKTPGLALIPVLTPFEVADDPEPFDLLIVDEAHRLNRRANQPSANLNTRFRTITERIFGHDDRDKTQLDWIIARSRHQILLVDPDQSVRPADLGAEQVRQVINEAQSRHRLFRLMTQMRVRAGFDYVGYVKRVLAGPIAGEQPVPADPADFGDYDVQMFDSLAELREAIRAKERESGLARMAAGFAWPWRSKSDKSAYDIEEDGLRLRWNSTDVDWIASPTSIEEVGSIHTVQGYDLNVAGVIIGRDLRYDADAGHLVFDRSSYFDARGKQNSPSLGRVFSDEDLLDYVRNIYAVLLTRGIRGTYLWVADPGLREYLRPYFTR